MNEPGWFLTPDEISKLNPTQIRQLVSDLYDQDEKGTMNSLHGASKRAGV